QPRLGQAVAILLERVAEAARALERMGQAQTQAGELFPIGGVAQRQLVQLDGARVRQLAQRRVGGGLGVRRRARLFARQQELAHQRLGVVGAELRDGLGQAEVQDARARLRNLGLDRLANAVVVEVVAVIHIAALCAPGYAGWAQIERRAVLARLAQDLEPA